MDMFENLCNKESSCRSELAIPDEIDPVLDALQDVAKAVKRLLTPKDSVLMNPLSALTGLHQTNSHIECLCHKTYLLES